MEKERLERIEFERQAREKAEKEAAEKAERDRKAAELAEQQRKAAEEAENRRIEAARPDIDKVRLFGKTLRELAIPAVQTEGAKQHLALIRQDLIDLAERCERYSVARRKVVSRS
jgi:hypothetical protein